MMPSGKAGFTTRIRTVMKPTSAPNTQRPALVWDALTGSVAMYTVPNANPPRVRCQYHGMAYMASVELPMTLNSVEVAIMPIITPAMTRQLAMRV